MASQPSNFVLSLPSVLGLHPQRLCALSAPTLSPTPLSASPLSSGQTVMPSLPPPPSSSSTHPLPVTLFSPAPNSPRLTCGSSSSPLTPFLHRPFLITLPLSLSLVFPLPFLFPRPWFHPRDPQLTTSLLRKFSLLSMLYPPPRAIWIRWSWHCLHKQASSVISPRTRNPSVPSPQCSPHSLFAQPFPVFFAFSAAA